MINTWGLGDYSVRSNAFGDHTTIGWNFGFRSENFYVTALKLQNTVLNLLGYVPAIATFSGIYRIAFGSLVLLGSLPKTPSLRNELLKTGVSQIIRGVLEAFYPATITFRVIVDFSVTISRLHSEPATSKMF